MVVPTRAGTIAAQAATCLPDATDTFDVRIEERRLNLFRHDDLHLYEKWGDHAPRRGWDSPTGVKLLTTTSRPCGHRLPGDQTGFS